MTPVVAVVPLRDGVSGKSRLAAHLTPAQRRGLVTELARHVLGTLAAYPFDEIVVVTADPLFAAEVLGDVLPPVTVLAEPPGRPGLNAALDAARASVREATWGARLLVAHADLPLLTVDDVEALLRAEADVVVATDRHGTGTNLLRLHADDEYAFRFGAGSRAAHEAEAARQGLRAVVVDRPGTAADLDTLDDWADLPAPTREHLAG
ncbi:2-phospho-L-lactate guanylyltransferase [Xylanimonas protaetiae]|uniref:Phosphoenolpyruvate guanylyltransferase n=1 Tax=Xylanimonas protaetiae TaxID=2509457 RepID=A0A4P6F0E5_9MICO|nr:2-phospho-L-lactate guanylyltransferase [Xylanimonas protaetiae]QAY69210.1 2-phospho-L-lactate guanylyltransferase [Xylanimonas protaetiae]